MKSIIKYLLQKILGLNRYLYWFAIFKIKTISKDKNEVFFFKFMDLIKDTGSVLDIGANIGVLSYHLSKKFPDRQIYSFEPIPLNISVLKKIIHRYELNNINVIEAALAENNAEIEMILPVENNVVMHGLAHVDHHTMKKFNSGDKITVKSLSLDNWVEENNISSIAAIKLDVENYEMFVLNGAQETINKYRPVIFSELWDNQNRVNCISYFEKLSYQVYVKDNKGLKLYQKEKDKTQNFIFFPQEKEDLLR